MIFDSRFYLEGPAGDRYFGSLATGRIPRVGAQLVQGTWGTNDGIDLVMLYFPLSDPAVAALLPSESLGIADPMSVVRAAMVGRTDYLETFSFNMITPQCLHSGEAELQHAEHEERLWRGIAIVAAAAAVFPLLGPALAGQGGLTNFAGQLATDVEHAVGPKILMGLHPPAWQVAQRVMSGEQVGDVLWDEGGHLMVNAIIDGTPRRLLVAGVQRGTASSEVQARVLATVREFVRDHAAQVVVQSAAGHADVVSLIRPDAGVDLATELLASGTAAARCQRPRNSGASANAHSSSGVRSPRAIRGPAVQDPTYEAVVQQLAVLAGS
jgi:hypothetical protein